MSSSVKGTTPLYTGNITTLSRYSASADTPQESYTYTYQGNQLASVNSANCTYDANGNLTYDGLKNLQLSYNLLNLPEVVSQSAAEIAKYGWFADGSKYSVLDNSNNGYCYIGSLIYASNNGNLQIESTNFAGGRINLAENTSTNTLLQDIQYHHKDHLGSVRAITDNSGSVIEQNAYYPFGSRHTFGNTYAQTTNRFKFNGKEEQTTGNLNYLDYGARMYDSNIGRWMVQDPLSEKYYAYSQYSFSGNNPILNIDSDGKAWDTFIDAAFLIYDLGSALYNHIIGEHNKAQQNWKDVGIDAASMIIPGVAAPMMKGVGKVANKLDNAADAGKGMKNADAITSQKHIKPNNGNSKPHGNSDHDNTINDIISEIRKDYNNQNIRKNQKQVDVNGNIIGHNRPDIQWDNNGTHYNYEVDRTPKNSQKHEDIIKKNDPNSIFYRKIIK